MRVSSVGQGIDVTNGDALAEEVNAAADVRALEVSEAGSGGGDRVVAFPRRLLEDAKLDSHRSGNGIAREQDASQIARIVEVCNCLGRVDDTVAQGEGVGTEIRVSVDAVTNNGEAVGSECLEAEVNDAVANAIRDVRPAGLGSTLEEGIKLAGIVGQAVVHEDVGRNAEAIE